MFIAIEGLDGVGKSGVVKYLKDKIEKELGKEVLIVREPGGTPVAELLRKIHKGEYFETESDELTVHTELLLLFAARSQNIKHNIEPALAAGKIVIADRFYLSTQAYQGYGLNAGLMELINTLIENTVTVHPDLHILLDAPIETILERREGRDNHLGDRIERRGIEFFQRAANGFKRLAKYRTDVIIISAIETEINVQQNVYNTIVKYLEK
jgi:dTMP kinase